MRIPSGQARIAAAVFIGLVSLANASPDELCYDAKVRARPVKQVPSSLPDCGSDCIVMSWPWFVDLKVSRTIKGKVSARRVRVLTIQHNHMRSRDSTWLLRKNNLGGFNVLRVDEDAVLIRCPNGAPPVEAYLRPGEGKTLEDLRSEGLRAYGDHAD